MLRLILRASRIYLLYHLSDHTGKSLALLHREPHLPSNSLIPYSKELYTRLLININEFEQTRGEKEYCNTNFYQSGVE